MTLIWRKSSYSDNSTSGDLCIEIADLSTGMVGIRDSKNPDGPHLSIPADRFAHLIRRIKTQN